MLTLRAKAIAFSRCSVAGELDMGGTGEREAVIRSPRVFLSYRRQDAAAYAGRLFDALVATFGEDSVFMDIDSIDPGLDFVDVIEEALQGCDVAIVVIGPSWVTAADAHNNRRLDDPEDLHRVEIESVLSRGIRVLPVLVGGALMPSIRELPPSLSALARRQGFALSDQRWHSDVTALVNALRHPARSLPLRESAAAYERAPAQATTAPHTSGALLSGTQTPIAGADTAENTVTLVGKSTRAQQLAEPARASDLPERGRGAPHPPGHRARAPLGVTQRNMLPLSSVVAAVILAAVAIPIFVFRTHSAGSNPPTASASATPASAHTAQTYISSRLDAALPKTETWHVVAPGPVQNNDPTPPNDADTWERSYCSGGADCTTLEVPYYWIIFEAYVLSDDASAHQWYADDTHSNAVHHAVAPAPQVDGADEVSELTARKDLSSTPADETELTWRQQNVVFTVGIDAQPGTLNPDSLQQLANVVSASFTQ